MAKNQSVVKKTGQGRPAGLPAHVFTREELQDEDRFLMEMDVNDDGTVNYHISLFNCPIVRGDRTPNRVDMVAINRRTQRGDTNSYWPVGIGQQILVAGRPHDVAVQLSIVGWDATDNANVVAAGPAPPDEAPSGVPAEDPKPDDQNESDAKPEVIKAAKAAKKSG